MDLDFNVTNQILVKNTRNRPVNLSQEYLRLCFTFSTDWTGLGKFAIFKVGSENIRVALSDDKVLVPGKALQGSKVLFTLYGVDNGNLRITTNLVKINLLESGFTKNVINDDSDLDDPSTVEEIYIELDKKVSTDDLNTALMSKADTVHTHNTTDIPGLSNYYTKQEVQEIIDGFNNKFLIDSTHNPVLRNEECIISTYLVQNGIPLSNRTVNIYEEYTTSKLTLEINKTLIITGENLEIKATLQDIDGSAIPNEEINIYAEE